MATLKPTTIQPKPRAVDGVTFKWLDGMPSSNTHTTEFGSPWAQGEVYKSTSFALRDASGMSVPVQSYPLAFWNDGSLKWTGHSIAPNSGLSDELTLVPDTPAEHDKPVLVEQTDSQIVITTGTFTAKLNTSGSTLIESLSLDGSNKAEGGQLLLQFQDAPDSGDSSTSPTVIKAVGEIESATVEQDGPIRAVVKITGRYHPQDSSRAPWLPFTIRFIVGAGGTELRLVHVFVYDGDQNKDFIKGLGLKFKVPMKEPDLWNRHIRFGGAEGGLFGEAVNGLTGLRRQLGDEVDKAQFEGYATPATSTWPATVTPYLDTLPVWNDYTLRQLSPDAFTIWKRINEQGSWLTSAGNGTRASGLGYVGGATGGGIVFHQRHFFEMAPRSLDIANAGSDAADVTVWAYSPAGDALDLRHYSTVDHELQLQYEDNPDPSVTSTPSGVARSYEISLLAVATTPTRSFLSDLSKITSAPPALFATPDFYASHQLFGGQWSAADPALDLEQKQTTLLDFYLKEVDSRKWYGAMTFGDVMHTYDSVRHNWRYDVGGYAWDNAELGTDLWLWMSFLRTGRADVFRMAWSMTRYISESACYHGGEFAGLGSRHNVSPWGDGAKEARVSGGHLRRPMYYLTGGDETLAEMADYALETDKTIVKWEALRNILPKPAAPTRVRIGPDWTALAGNWLFKWERTGDTYYRDRIETGMKDIGSFQYGLFSGYTAAVGFDPVTAHLTMEEETSPSFKDSYHLTMLFGGGELLMELVTLIDVPEFDKAWIDFCWLFSGTDAEKTARYGRTWNSGGFYQLYSKLLAYSGMRLGDQSLVDRAWATFNANKTGVWPDAVTVGGSDIITPAQEIFGLATNDAASLSLAMFTLLKIYPAGAPASAQPTARLALVAADESASLASLDSDESASTYVGIYGIKAQESISDGTAQVKAVKKRTGGLRRFFACGSGANVD